MPLRSVSSRLRNILLESSGSQNMILRPEILQSPENLLEMKVLGPNSDLLNQYWGWGPAICVLTGTNTH